MKLFKFKIHIYISMKSQDTFAIEPNDILMNIKTWVLVLIFSLSQSLTHSLFFSLSPSLSFSLLSFIEFCCLSFHCFCWICKEKKSFFSLIWRWMRPNQWQKSKIIACHTSITLTPSLWHSNELKRMNFRSLHFMISIVLSSSNQTFALFVSMNLLKSSHFSHFWAYLFICFLIYLLFILTSCPKIRWTNSLGSIRLHLTYVCVQFDLTRLKIYINFLKEKIYKKKARRVRVE